MKRYNPEIPPDPREWLALDEQVRIHLVEAYHRAVRIKLPNATLHAAIHAIVENQIAEGLDPVVRAMQRLADDGLPRHEAIHAIGCVCTEHLFGALNAEHQEAGLLMPRYIAGVELLTAKSWRQQFGAETK